MSISYDPFSAEAHEDPYPAYRVLRDELPVYYNAERGFWALSRNADVRMALRDWRRFSSAQGPARSGELMDADPPHHGALRRIVAPRLRYAAVQELEPFVRATARKLTAALDPASADLSRGFSRPLPALTICRALGVCDADAPAMTGLALRAIAAGTQGLEARAALVEALLGLVEERRRSRSRQGILGDLAVAIESGAVGHGEVAGLCMMLIVAGIEPTASLLECTLHGLATARISPRELRAVDGQLSAAAVGELVRLESPVQWLSRYTTQPVWVHGRRIPPNARVLLLIGSANRDPRAFERPDVFDAGRSQASAVAFGNGIHACLGIALARLEARVALEVLLDSVVHLRVAGQPLRSASHVVRGYDRLPVSLARS